MALDLWVYGDESGKKEDRYSLVSAYIANQRTWDVLRKEWEPVIRSAGLTELHAEKVFTRKAAARGGSTSNPYASWSHDDALVFIAEIGRIIRRHRRSIRPIAVVLDGPDFRALPHGERRALTSGHFKFWEHDQHRKWASDGKPSEPYMLAFQRVVQAALEMCPPDAKVHLVFDINKNVEVAASRLTDMVLELKSWPLYERLAKGLNYRDSADYPGIQMADLLGYLLNRFVGMGQTGMGEEQAWALSRVCGIRIQYEFFGARELEETLDANLTPEHRAWLKSQVQVRAGHLGSRT